MGSISAIYILFISENKKKYIAYLLLQQLGTTQYGTNNIKQQMNFLFVLYTLYNFISLLHNIGVQPLSQELYSLPYVLAISLKETKNNQ